MAVIVRGASTNHGVEVTEKGSAQVALPTSAQNEDAGFVKLAVQVDNGDVTGTPLVRELDENDDYALRTAQDNTIFDKRFSGDIVNTSIWKQTVVGMSISQSVDPGYIVCNSTGSVTPGQVAVVQSYRTIPLFGSVSNYFAFRAKIIGKGATGSEMFLGAAVYVGVPQNGFAFIWGADGELRGTCWHDAALHVTDPIVSPDDGETHYYLITYTDNTIQFTIDDVLVATLVAPVGISGLIASSAVRLLFGVVNTGVASSPSILSMSSAQVLHGGPTFYRQQQVSQAQQGNNSYQGQTSFPQGVESTANYVLDTAPTFVALAHGGSAYDTLGGQYYIEVPDAAEEDFALFGWKNPISNNIVGKILEKQLVITGIKVSAVNFGDAIDVTGDPVIIEWSLGVGCTADDINTVESVNTKSPRIIPLGLHSFPAGTAAGVSASDIVLQLLTPAVVDSGQYCHVIVRVISGNSGSYRAIRGHVYINGYFE
jgi:hypothetical protein